MGIGRGGQLAGAGFVEAMSFDRTVTVFNNSTLPSISGHHNIAVSSPTSHGIDLPI